MIPPRCVLVATDKTVPFSHGSTAVRGSQAISQRLLSESAVGSLELAGNIIDSAELARMDGFDAFLSRRGKNKSKSLQGGGMLTLSLCGLD